MTTERRVSDEEDPRPLAVIVVLPRSPPGRRRPGRQAEVVKLTFATYVWQPTTVAATKSIVEAWNKTPPGIQVTIVPVDVNSVHDKLLTNFVGGTAADVIHDEAADIAGLHPAGLPGEPHAADPEAVQGVDPEVAVGHGQLRPQRITGVPILIQTYNVFANMDILKAAGIKAPDREEPVDVDAVPLDREAAHERDGGFGVCWGLRSPTAAIQTMALNFGGQYFYLENGKWNFKLGRRASRPS